MPSADENKPTFSGEDKTDLVAMPAKQIASLVFS
jgi:hypothetical protein